MVEPGKLMELAVQGGVGAILIIVFVGGVIVLCKYALFPLLDKLGRLTSDLREAMESAKDVTESATKAIEAGKAASEAAKAASDAALQASRQLEHQAVRLGAVCRGGAS
jgi:Sec-independent protein translocase protein TatA